MGSTTAVLQRDGLLLADMMLWLQLSDLSLASSVDLQSPPLKHMISLLLDHELTKIAINLPGGPVTAFDNVLPIGRLTTEGLSTPGALFRAAFRFVSTAPVRKQAS